MLIQNAEAILTGLGGPEMRSPGRDIRIIGSRIAEIGQISPRPGEPQLDAQGCIIYPGWVNTHHHLLQSVMKGVPAGLNEGLNGWLACTWYQTGMGDLDVQVTMRLALWGFTMLVLGGQTIFGSFFLSLLSMTENARKLAEETK